MQMLDALTEPDQRAGGRILRWYVVETHPMQERRVARSLAEADYTAYLPIDRVKRRDRKAFLGWRWEHAPMFGNYLFFQLEPDVTPWTPVRYMEGVRRVHMSAAQRPVPLPVGFVEGLIADAPRRLELPDLKLPEFPKDTLLRVVEGPLSGQCVLCKRSDQERTDVEIEIFGGRVMVQMPNSALIMWEAGFGP